MASKFCLPLSAISLHPPDFMSLWPILKTFKNSNRSATQNGNPGSFPPHWCIHHYWQVLLCPSDLRCVILPGETSLYLPSLRIKDVHILSRIKDVKWEALLSEVLSNSLRTSATKAVCLQRQGRWSSSFGKILWSQFLFSLAQECANHHPGCREHAPDAGGKSQLGGRLVVSLWQNCDCHNWGTSPFTPCRKKGHGEGIIFFHFTML